MVEPALLGFIAVSLVWAFQWAGFGTFLRFNNGVFVFDIAFLLAAAYGAFDFARPDPRIWNTRMLVGAVTTGSTASLLVVSLLLVWTQSIIESLAVAKQLAILLTIPMGVAYIWWAGPRLDPLPPPEATESSTATD